MGTGLESCGRAEGLEWVAGPWWQLDRAHPDDSDAGGSDGAVGDAGGDWDAGGGVGLVYVVAGGETPCEYGARVAAWRSILRGAPGAGCSSCE